MDMFCLSKADRTFNYLVSGQDASGYVCIDWDKYTPEALTAAYDEYLTAAHAEAPTSLSVDASVNEEVPAVVETPVVDQEASDVEFAALLEQQAQAELDEALLDEVA